MDKLFSTIDISLDAMHPCRMPLFSATMQTRLRQAYDAGCQSVNIADPKNLPESFDAIKRVEEYRWHWRPRNPRLILIAESHVYTSDADLNIKLDEGQIVKLCGNGNRHSPSGYVRFVYCLAYGENKLLLESPAEFNNRGTIQFWDLFGKLAATDRQPRVGESSAEQRLGWKLRTLNQLKDRGVWLLDASSHAVYFPKRKKEKDAYRRSAMCCREFHKAWWENYGRYVIDECSTPIKWVIGKSVYDHLARQLGDLKIKDYIFQPNARVDPAARRERLDRLVSDVMQIG